MLCYARLEQHQSISMPVQWVGRGRVGMPAWLSVVQTLHPHQLMTHTYIPHILHCTDMPRWRCINVIFVFGAGLMPVHPMLFLLSCAMGASNAVLDM